MSYQDRQQLQRMNSQGTDSWPIKLVMRFGIKDPQQAKIVVLLISVFLLIITVILYSRILSPSVSDDGVSEEVILEMEASL